MRLVLLFALSTGCAEYDLSEIGDTVAPPMGPEIAGAGDEDSSDDAGGNTSSSGGGRLVIGLNELKPGGTDEIAYTTVQDLPGFQDGTGGTGSEGGLGLASVGDLGQPELSGPSFGLTPISGGGAGSDQIEISTSVGTDPVADGAIDQPDVGQVTPIGDWWAEPWEDPPGGPPTNEQLEAEWADDELAGMHGCSHVGDEDTGFGQIFALRCWSTEQPSTLGMNLGAYRFSMDEVGWIVCLDDPALTNLPDFDTVAGVVYGHMNTGEQATLWFVYTDNGHPDTLDSARFELELSDGTVLSGEGYLSAGNHDIEH